MDDDIAYSVLIVDDSPFIQQYLYQLFAGNGFIVKGLADSGFDAIEKYKMLNPDLVIMDENMPGMDGVRAMQRIMEHDYDAEVIIITGFSDVNSSKAYASGASAFFAKPVEDRELFIKVCKELAQKKFDNRKKQSGKK